MSTLVLRWLQKKSKYETDAVTYRNAARIILKVSIKMTKENKLNINILIKVAVYNQSAV